MVKEIMQQIWDTARLMLSPGDLIDQFLDWLEELSGADQIDRLVTSKVRAEALVDAATA